jgi:hypothetical protein
MDYILFGSLTLWGLLCLSRPNVVLRFHQAFYGPRFNVRPIFIRVMGVVFMAVTFLLFWGRISK